MVLVRNWGDNSLSQPAADSALRLPQSASLTAPSRRGPEREPVRAFSHQKAPSLSRETESEEAPAAQESRSRFTEEEEPVSPIFERRAPRSREATDAGYEGRASRPASGASQQRRAPRVYQEDGVSEPPRTQSRRGFTPDVPSFMRKK